eukprot:SAG11_NODE_9489_length_907_cov_1.079208_1_plen_220_part_10
MDAGVRLAPLSPRAQNLQSPRWHPPQLSPRISPAEVAQNVLSSRYIRQVPVIPPEWRQSVLKPEPPLPRPSAAEAPVAVEEEEVASAQQDVAETATVAADVGQGQDLGQNSAQRQEEPKEEEVKEEAPTESDDEWAGGEEDEEGEDDDFDEKMIMIQRQRGRGAGGGGNRRMSLADMKGSDMMAGMLKLREQLTPLEVDEYRDFFDLVDEDRSNSIDKDE